MQQYLYHLLLKKLCLRATRKSVQISNYALKARQPVGVLTLFPTFTCLTEEGSLKLHPRDDHYVRYYSVMNSRHDTFTDATFALLNTISHFCTNHRGIETDPLAIKSELVISKLTQAIDR